MSVDLEYEEQSTQVSVASGSPLLFLTLRFLGSIIIIIIFLCSGSSGCSDGGGHGLFGCGDWDYRSPPNGTMVKGPGEPFFQLLVC